jgi:hypothetical protein
MSITSLFAGSHRCRIIGLLLQSVVPIIGFVLPLLELLLLPLPFVNGSNIEYRSNHLQLEVVCYASTCARTILLTKLVLW